MEQLYDVFVRDWYRWGQDGRKVPGPGPKEYQARGLTWTEARDLCTEYNTNTDPGPLSRKAEFERE